MACFYTSSFLINSFHSLLDDYQLDVPFVEGVYTNKNSISINEKHAFFSLSNKDIIADSGFHFSNESY